jgi:hypothetical protein
MIQVLGVRIFLALSFHCAFWKFGLVISEVSRLESYLFSYFFKLGGLTLLPRGLELMSRSEPSECWDYRCALLCPASLGLSVRVQVFADTYTYTPGLETSHGLDQSQSLVL